VSGPLRKDTDPFVKSAIDRVDREFQRVEHKQFAAVPLAGEVPEGGFVLATIAGTSYIYTKVNGTLKRVALT
jgi:hypothetical protein